jgi:hypothetical protein
MGTEVEHFCDICDEGCCFNHKVICEECLSKYEKIEREYRLLKDKLLTLIEKYEKENKKIKKKK